MRNTISKKNAPEVLHALDVVRGYKAGSITCGHYGSYLKCKPCRKTHDLFMDVIADAYVAGV